MKMIVRSGGNSTQQITSASNGVDFEHFSDGTEVFNHVVMAALNNRQRYKGNHPEPDLGRIKCWAKSQDDLISLQPLQAKLNCPAGHTQRAAKGRNGGSRVLRQFSDNASVSLMQFLLLGHNATLLFAVRMRNR